MIFNDDTLRYANPESHEIMQRMESFYAEVITHNQAFWTEATIDTQFLAGSQSFYNDLYGPMFPGKRKNFYFNRIRPIVNGVSGRQRQVYHHRANESAERAGQQIFERPRHEKLDHGLT